MPKSSRHRSHRHSKHSSKDAKEYSESEEDAKMRDIKEGLAKVPRSSGLSEKRKDHPGYSNGDVAEQYVGSKRRKEKEKGDVNGAFDRWNNAEVVESVIKGESSRVDGERTSKSKSILESKSKSSSRVHNSGSEKKEERKEGSKVETKRKYEKELERKVVQHSKDPKESKEKVKIVEKERKVNDREREVEDEVVDIGDAVIPSLEFGKEHEGRHGKANNVWPVQGERNLELEKELEKRSRIRHGSNEKEKYQDDVKVSGDRRVSFREEPAKDGKYRGDKYLVGSHGDKHRDDGDRETRYKDDNYAEDIDKERRYGDANYRERSEVRRYKGDKDRGDVDGDKKLRDDKYSEGGNQDKKHRDAKYLDDADKDYRRKVDRYHEDGDHREGGDKDDKYRDAKYREDTDKDYRRKVDKYHEGDYREGSDKDNKHTTAKYDEEADKEYRRRVDKYHEDVDRDDRYRDDRYFEDISRGSRNREERNWEDAIRDGRGRDGKQRDDSVKDKRLRDIKYLDERLTKDGTNDNPDTKRSRDQSEVAEVRQKKSMNPDDSPNLDDWSTRYKDDRGKRRATDKEDYDDNRFLSIKRQQLDLEKKSVGTRVESVGNRVVSSLRDGDMVVNSNHGRRGNSPTHRLFKHDESRFREYANGGRERRDVIPGKEYAGLSGVTEKVFRLNDKSLQKDDGHGDDASSERRLKDDAPISPFQRVDKSLSSASNDRRNLSGQKTGSSKETKEYYGRDNRGNRELPIENFPTDENFQPDSDNFCVSSPFTKSGHFNNNNNNRSLLPPTPFRSGPDRPFNDENRNKPNQRRRMDPNMGRLQGNAWRGVPNWPPPVANGFIPFPHGPPPLNFHPVMPQFPTPPIFMRPSMEMNQSGVPFHMQDGDRFPGHGRPLGWDGNNPIFGDESHMYGRLDWDHSRGYNSGQGWETSRDMWKGQSSVVNAEVSASPLKDDPWVGELGEEDWAGKSAPQTDKKRPSVKAESTNIEHSTDVVSRDVAEASKAVAEDMSHSKIKDDDYFARAYLSMLDISEDLSHYELYSQYTNLVVVDQNVNAKEDDSRLLIMQEDIDAFGKNSSKTSSASLFPTIDDSIFQRVMSQYKKLKVVMSMGQDKAPSPTIEETEPVLPIDLMEADSNHEHQKEAQITVSDISKMKVEASAGIGGNTIDEQMMIDDELKPSEPIAALIKVKMEIDPMEETADNIAEDGSLTLKEVDTYSTNNTAYDGDNLKNGKFVSPCVGASVEVGFEGVIESGSVNLSWIHLSSESTH